MIGRNVSMLMGEPDRSEHDSYISNYLTTSKANIIGTGREVEALHKDGSTLNIYLSVSEFWHEEERYFAGVLHDVTDRKNAEERLRQSEKRLGLVLEASADGWWDHDLIKNETFWSDGMFRMLGYQPGEVQPSARLDEELTHPEDLALRRKVYLAHLYRDKPCQVDFRIRKKSGDYVWVRISGRALRDDTGRAVRITGTVIDISDTMDKEEQLQRAARLETIGQLTGGIAHDFNNILTVISGNLELLEMQIEDPDQRELLTDATDATEMGATLTDRVVETFARKRHLEPETLNLNDVVLHLTDLLQRTLAGPIDLSTVLLPSLWSTRVDPGQVENAIMNLIINARDAMPDGGRVIVETKNTILDRDYAEIEPSLEPGEYVLLTVTDTGSGMPLEVVEHVFEPFFTTKEAGRGTGLGLSMVYGFAKQAGGHVTLYSEVGLGTTVNIYLPAIKKHFSRSAEAHKDTAVVRGTGQKVLIVEDDPQVRVLTVRRVQGLGYVVRAADSAKSALDILGEDRDVDLVFTDIVMQGSKTGFELAKEIRKTRPGMKVLLTSGYAEELVHPDSMKKYDLKVLRKPYPREALARALFDALES